MLMSNAMKLTLCGIWYTLENYEVHDILLLLLFM
jgi:hypothetical protein